MHEKRRWVKHASLAEAKRVQPGLGRQGVDMSADPLRVDDDTFAFMMENALAKAGVKKFPAHKMTIVGKDVERYALLVKTTSGSVRAKLARGGRARFFVITDSEWNATTMTPEKARASFNLLRKVF